MTIPQNIVIMAGVATGEDVLKMLIVIAIFYTGIAIMLWINRRD